MASIYKEIIIEDTPDYVWDVIRDVGSVHRRLLPGRVANTEIVDGIRTLTFPDQSVTREKIITVDDDLRRMAYAVIETRMALTFHHATFQVYPGENCKSRLVWITDFLPDSCTDEVRARIEYGARDMKLAIERHADRP